MESSRRGLRSYMYPGSHAGVALYTYKLANALVDLGIDVTLFVDDRYELDHLPAKFNKAKVLSSGYEGIRQNRCRIARRTGIIRAHLYNSGKFLFHVWKNRPHIVHLHNFFFYPLEWYLLVFLKRVPCKIVLTVHNVVPYRSYIRAMPRFDLCILGYIYRAADKLIVHSQASKNQLLARFSIDEGRVEIIPHGEYSFNGTCEVGSQDEVRTRLHIAANEKVLLFFGYIRRIKGIDVLLRAFELVAAELRDAVLVIVGSEIEGESLSDYDCTLRLLRHRDKVRFFLEYVEYHEIPLFFVPADIVVLPYVELTGQSGVLHLAQGFGKPVIATDVGGLPDAVKDGENGLIVPAGDVEALANAMTYLLTHDNIRTAMGQTAKALAMERFSWGNIARATVEKVYL